MRTNLQVPFAEKDEAKSLGARWDATKRVWYVQNVADLSAFARWLPPSGALPSGPARSGTGKGTGSAPVVKTGARFIELDCSCLPWVGCSRCQEALRTQGWTTRG